MTIPAQSARLLKVTGETLEVACGATQGTGTTTTVTVPQLRLVKGAIAINDSTTHCYVSTLSGTTNSFVVTHGSADDLCWIAWGIAKV